ncbi:SLC13 family permease [Polyangium sorediatum]|uniref:SLC13 family permease n=1 Tax=Polyangium sorediatum TaxID=889274 RepID=A0ABT6P7A5_9BACT|nr:SLC13 family permease [Polyangium sorediatum]MDI1436492.1 SLC13 family permease [Polyangium sorediatum]
MTQAQIILSGILLLALFLQAFLPSYRVLVVCAGAGLSCLATTLLGVANTSRILAEVPWDVLIILVTLGLVSQLLAASRLFDRLALVATRASRGDPHRLTLVFAVAMYGVSAVVNNLTALVLVLPVLHVLLRLGGTNQRYVSWTLGVLLVACNLGGAATPIGDFPAILLLGRGSMTFVGYLVNAGPATLVALGVLLLVTALVVRPAKGMPRDPISAGIARAVMTALHRRITLDRRIFWPAAASLLLMIAAWLFLPTSLGVGPELVCWLGASLALLLNRGLGERLTRNGLEAEAVLFLLSLFVMVGAVRDTGLFELVARSLERLPLSGAGQLFVFLLFAGVLTGLFSAGPSMAALLEVAESLAKRLPPSAVYVGLALSVCAGSSLFLTAATSGPLAQALTERADIRDPEGRPLRFGFFDFLPTGLVGFAIIEATAIGYAAWVLARAG